MSIKWLKRVWIIGLFFCLFSCSGFDDYDAFAKIHGTVTDYQIGIPLDNASVTLSPLGITKQTDANGYYRFENLEPQQYTITVQRTGYQPNRKTVSAISDEIQQVDIQLISIP